MKYFSPILVAALLTACATHPAEPPPDPIVARLQKAFERLHADDVSAAETLADGVLAHPDFPDAELRVQFGARYLAGALAYDRKDYAKALPLLQQTATSEYADMHIWHLRLYAEFASKQYVESARSVAVIAHRWPESLRDISDPALQTVVRETKKVPAEAETYRALLKALYEAGWKTKYGLEPSYLWLDLAGLHVERGEFEQAARIVERIRTAGATVALRVDRRFDPLKLDRARLDVRKALAADLAEARQVAAAHPTELDTVVGLAYALLATKRYPEVLEVTAPFEGRWTPESPVVKQYKDWDERIVWVMDLRARALAALGRFDEAATLLRDTAAKKEGSSANVSQAINLGELLARMGRPREALEAIAAVGEMSSYGRMQLEDVRLMAALIAGDRAGMESGLAYLREHHADAPTTAQDCLARAGAIDEAAALLIGRLRDPVQRAAALRDVQGYYEPPAASKWETQWRGLHGKLLQRRDVIEAVNKVGRIERFDYMSLQD